MDQIKIGRFIAQRRKEQSMTQRQLADILGISDKTVSKWETGNGLPEVSLMLPLCDCLGINVNELLSGERLTDFNYKLKAEENMMDLVNEQAQSRKKLLLSAVVCALTLLAGILLILLAGNFPMTALTRGLLIGAAVLEIAGGVAVAVALDLEAGTFQCAKCGARFVPTPGAYIAGPHTLTKRKLKCPRCGEVSYCKKRLTH